MQPDPAKRPGPEATEAIAGHTAVAFDELWDLCVKGRLHDSFTLGAAVRLYPHFRTGRFEIDRGHQHQ